MRETAIIVRGVSKKYRLFDSAQDRLKEALHPFSKRYHREFLALNEVSFEIPRGQVVGIIGRNGSGKSTLLQIISGIVQPTNGEVIVNGLISALIELGAGFNPEFTGRDNVVLQAQIMGLSDKEIDRKVIEIESFADIGEFFDQPVKIYSSGMFVRLAFSAAINCDPDILIIDEAMAVGDVKFQALCYNKIDEFKAAGRTIIFVTHDYEAVNRHCDRAILLEAGKVIADGKPMNVIGTYLDLIEGRTSSATQPPSLDKSAPANLPLPVVMGEMDSISDAVKTFLQHHGDNFARRNTYNVAEINQPSTRASIIDYLLVTGDTVYPGIITSGNVIDLYFAVRFHDSISHPAFGFALRNKEGILIDSNNSAFTENNVPPAAKGATMVVKFHIPLPLASGEIFFDLGVDELVADAVNSLGYNNICRRMLCIMLTIYREKPMFGLVDLGSRLEYIPTNSAHQ